MPGSEWAPAWVAWRRSDQHVGWAPLPPRRSGPRGEVVYSGRAISGYVDIDFDIGPSYYNFVDVRYIGAPVLSHHIFEPARNVTYINQTVNVTNITYTNNVVHNYGPDYNRLSAYSTRPIQRLNLERSSDFAAGARDGSRGFSRVQGDQLIIAAPARIEQSAQRVAPPTVKTKVEQPSIETGWSDVTDEKARADIRARMQKEDRTAVPPPDIPVQNPEALKAAAEATPPVAAPSPTVDPEVAEAAAATAGGTSNQDRGRQKDRIGDAAPEPLDPATRPEATPPGSDAAATPSRGRDRREQRQQVRQPQAPAPDEEAPETAAAPEAQAPGAGADRRGRGQQRAQQPEAREVPPASPRSEPVPATPEAEAEAPSAAAPARTERGPRQNKQRPVREAAPEAEAPVIQPQIEEPVRREQVRPSEGEQPEARGRGRKAEREMPPAVNRPPDVPPQPPQPRMREMPPPQAVPPSAPREEAAPQPGGERQRPERGRGQKKKENASPSEEE